MIRRTFLVAAVLLVATTWLSIGSFRLYYRDFFYLRKVYLSATEKDRQRLIRIARKLDYRDQRNTATSMMLAEALMSAGEQRRATRILSEQVALNPDSLGIRRAYAEALAVQGRAEEADREFQKLLRSLRQEKSGRAVKEGT